MGWLRRQISRTLAADGDVRRELLQMIVDYEHPGDGGYYDNYGTANVAPHVVYGYPYDHEQPYVQEMLSEGDRPGQRAMHFAQDEQQGVTLHYRDLDPEAKYKIRFIFVRPCYQERYAERMNLKSRCIYADDILIADQIELPLQLSDFLHSGFPQKQLKMAN